MKYKLSWLVWKFKNNHFEALYRLFHSRDTQFNVSIRSDRRNKTEILGKIVGRIPGFEHKTSEFTR